MKKSVRDPVLAIHPEFAEAIYDGRKDWEFRLVPPPVDDVVFIYETRPVCAVTGVLHFAYKIEGDPAWVWAVVKALRLFHSAEHNKPGISKKQFDEYTKGKEKVAALRVLAALRFAKPITLLGTPPQNWYYISREKSFRPADGYTLAVPRPEPLTPEEELADTITRQKELDV